MRQADRLTVSSLFPAILLAVSLLLVTAAAVSAYQPRLDISDVSLDNASLNVHVLVKEDGHVSADASFHIEKEVQEVPASFARFPLKSGKLQVKANRLEDNLVKLNADVQAVLVEDELGNKVKLGLTYLSNMPIEDVNEKLAPKVKSLYSRLEKIFKTQVRTARRISDNDRKVLENARLPELKEFRITSFSWESPKLKVSATGKLAHSSFENLDFPMKLNVSADVSKRSAKLNASFSATPKGSGLESAGFDLSISQKDNLASLDVSASAEGRMPKQGNSYVVDFSRYMKGAGRKRFQKLENVEFPEGFHATFRLEVPKGFSVENQPSAPSYCKTEKCRTRVWENRDAVKAVASLLSGKSSLAVKPVSEEETQTTFPYVYVAVGIALAAAATGGAYWKRKHAQGGSSFPRANLS